MAEVVNEHGQEVFIEPSSSAINHLVDKAFWIEVVHILPDAILMAAIMAGISSVIFAFLSKPLTLLVVLGIIGLLVLRFARRS